MAEEMEDEGTDVKDEGTDMKDEGTATKGLDFADVR